MNNGNQNNLNRNDGLSEKDAEGKSDNDIKTSSNTDVFAAADSNDFSDNTKSSDNETSIANTPDEKNTGIYYNKNSERDTEKHFGVYTEEKKETGKIQQDTDRSENPTFAFQDDPNINNAAEVLNSYLFKTAPLNNFDPPKKDTAHLKRIWKIAGILMLTAVIAFSGAFFGFFWVCRTSILGDSEFFKALIMQSSGITVNRVEVETVSGNYEEDTVTLAEKITECSIEIRIYNSAQERVGSGSGVILSEDGLAITNYHVVYGYENTLKAVMSDGTVCDVLVLHLDKISDLAVIKLVTTKKLPQVTWADSDKAVHGKSVAVCGNPVGLGFSVSFGNIAHPDRDLGDTDGNFIQLDVSVNPGNSGGGVFDGAGNLIGIVNSKATGTNVDGIGYAIPSNRVLDVVNQLLQNGYVGGRPAIGLTLVQVNESTWDYFKNGDGVTPGELADYLYESQYGIYIISSKYSSGIQKGDRIISCNGVEFPNRESFSNWLLKYKPGDKVVLEVERIVGKEVNPDGTYHITRGTLSVTITLQERDWADEPYSTK